MPKPSPQECAELIKQAREARKLAYAPYSNSLVGAAVLTSKNEIICGANIENASYSLTICAERTALFYAHLLRAGKVTALAVSAGKGMHTRPCGACLQVMMELAPNLQLILDDGNGGYDLFTLAKLLPQPFTHPPKN